MANRYKNAYAARSSEPRSRNYRSSPGGVGSGRLGMGRAGSQGRGAGSFFGGPSNAPKRPIPLPRGSSVPRVPFRLPGGPAGAAAYWIVRFGLFGPWFDDEYGEIKQDAGSDYYPDSGDGWTLACRTAPNPLETFRKEGINPGAGVGSADVTPGICNVSSINRANAFPETTVPPGSTLLQRVCAGLPYNPANPPSRNGRVYERWVNGNPGGSTQPVVFGEKTAPLPMDLSWPEPDTFTKMQPQTKGSSVGPYVPGYNGGIEFTPGGGVRPSGPHKPVPPRAGTQERKYDVPWPAALAAKGFHTLTEIGDAAECLFEALPKKVQGDRRYKAGGLAGKVRAIVENASLINWHGAVMCLIANQAEDRLIGGLSGGAGKAFTKATGHRPAPLGPRGVTPHRTRT